MEFEKSNDDDVRPSPTEIAKTLFDHTNRMDIQSTVIISKNQIVDYVSASVNDTHALDLLVENERGNLVPDVISMDLPPLDPPPLPDDRKAMSNENEEQINIGESSDEVNSTFHSANNNVDITEDAENTENVESDLIQATIVQIPEKRQAQTSAENIANEGVEINDEKEEEDDFGDFGGFQTMEGHDLEKNQNEKEEFQTFPENGFVNTVANISNDAIEVGNDKEGEDDFGNFGDFQTMEGDGLEINANKEEVQTFTEIGSSTVANIPNDAIDTGNDKQGDDFGDFGDFQTMEGDGLEMNTAKQEEVQTFAEMEVNQHETNFDAFQTTSESGVTDFGVFESTAKVQTIDDNQIYNFDEVNDGSEIGGQSNIDSEVAHAINPEVGEFGTSQSVIESKDADLFESKDSTSAVESSTIENDFTANETFENNNIGNVSDDDEDFGDFHDADGADSFQNEPAQNTNYFGLSQPAVENSNHNVDTDLFGSTQPLEMDTFGSTQPTLKSANEDIETDMFGSVQPSTNIDVKPETMFGTMQPAETDVFSKADTLGTFQGTDVINKEVEADPFQELQQPIPTDNSLTDPVGSAPQFTTGNDNVEDVFGAIEINSANDHAKSDVFGSIQPTIATTIATDNNVDPFEGIQPTAVNTDAEIDVFGSIEPINLENENITSTFSNSIQPTSAKDNVEIDDPFASIPPMGGNANSNIEKDIFGTLEPMGMNSGIDQVQTDLFGSIQPTKATDNIQSDLFGSTPISTEVNSQKDISEHQDELASTPQPPTVIEPAINNTQSDAPKNESTTGMELNIQKDDTHKLSLRNNDDNDSDDDSDDFGDFGDFHDSSNALDSSNFDVSTVAALNPSNSELFGRPTITMNPQNGSNVGSTDAKLDPDAYDSTQTKPQNFATNMNNFETGSEEKKVTDGYDDEGGTGFRGSLKEAIVSDQAIIDDDPFKALQPAMGTNLSIKNSQLDAFGSVNLTADNNAMTNFEGEANELGTFATLTNKGASCAIPMTTKELHKNVSTDDDDDDDDEDEEFGEFHDSKKEMPEFSLSHSISGMNNNTTTGVSDNIQPQDSNDEDAFGDFHDSFTDVTQPNSSSGIPFQNNMLNNMNSNPLMSNNITTMHPPSNGFATANNFSVNNQISTNSNFTSVHSTPSINGGNGFSSSAMNNNSTEKNAITDAFSMFD